MRHRVADIASQEGFTLIEWAVGVAVLAILIAVGYPTFNAVMQSNRLTSQTNMLIAGFNSARSEAISRSAKSLVCASGDGTACGSDWSKGWLVCEAEAAASCSSNKVIRFQEGSGDMRFDGPTAFAFDERGRRDDTSTGDEVSLSFQLQECEKNTENMARVITVGPTGSINSEKVNCR